MVATRTDTDRAFVINTDAWPQWPLLPLKRANNRLADKNIGFLFAEDAEIILYFAYILDGIREDTETKTYASLDELFADGWRVD